MWRDSCPCSCLFIIGLVATEDTMEHIFFQMCVSLCVTTYTHKMYTQNIYTQHMQMTYTHDMYTHNINTRHVHTQRRPAH